MEGLPLLNIIGGILMYVAKLLILIAAILAVIKNKNTGSILLLLGIVLLIIGDIVGMALLVNAGSQGPEQVVKITGVNAVIAALTNLLFAVGILTYVLQSLKAYGKQTKSS